MPDLLLAINIGNTNTQLGFFSSLHKPLILEKASNDGLEKFFKQWPRQQDTKLISSVRTVLMVSVNPHIESILDDWIKHLFKLTPLKPDQDFKIPMPILVDEPAKVGRDRLLSALAAYERLHQSCLIVSFGTATTFNVVSAKGEFLGGAIAPGIQMMTESLHKNCAFLPRAEPTPVQVVIGKNTQQAIQAGTYFGSIGLINHLIDKILAEGKSTLGSNPKIIATGGGAELIAPSIPRITQIIPTLTLEGLILAFNKHRA